MRSHLLHDQDRQFIDDTKLLGHSISRCVGTDGALTHGQAVMVFHDHLLDQRFALRWIVKVFTGILCYTSIFKFHMQIFKLDITDINTADLQHTIGSC